MKNFGKLLKTERQQLGVTQLDLSKALGVSRTSVVNYEVSNQMPSIKVIMKLCRIFDKTPNYFLIGGTK